VVTISKSIMSWQNIAGFNCALALFLHIAGLDLGVVPLLLALLITSFSLLNGKLTTGQLVCLVLLIACTFALFSLELLQYEFFVISFFIILGALAASDWRILNSTLKTSMIIALCLGTVALPEGLFGGRTSVFGVNPVWQSWLFSFGFLVNWTFTRSRSLFIIISLVLASAIIGTGTRAAILATISAVLALELMRGRAALSVFFISIFSGVGIYAIQNRLTEISGSRSLFEDMARLEMYRIAASEIIDNPFGYGFGDFHYLHWDYPHNILLEITHATGIIGLAVFLIILIFAFLKLVSHKSEVVRSLVPFLVITFILALFSGSLVSHRALYFVLGASIAVPSRTGRREQTPAQQS